MGPVPRLEMAHVASELRGFLHHTRSALVGVAVASGLINLLMLVAPLFMLQVYDRVLPSRSLSTLLGLLIIATVLFAAQGVLDAVRQRLLVRISELFDASLRERVFDAGQHAALLRRSDRAQIARDLDTLRSFIASSGLIALCDLPWTPVYLLVCLLFHPLMGLAIFVGAVVLGAVAVATEVMTRRPMQQAVDLLARRRTALESAYAHAETVHALGMRDRMAQLWFDRTAEYLRVNRRAADLSTGFSSLSRILRTMLQSGVLALGAWLVINQQATAGVMLAATVISIRALAPIDLAIANWRNFIGARGALARLSHVLETTPVRPPTTALPKPARHLRVAGLTLTPPGSQSVILHDVSFALDAGSVLAIVGPSGSGKSSLARALTGAWRPARGVIRIDGAALDQWDPVSLGRSVGYMPQDVALFSGTVAQNISRFEPSVRAEALIAAAMAAGVHELVLRLPQGYETEVGDTGVMLSGGQRQRIALACALYDDPFIVVLDEPNANLDSEGERALARAIANVRSCGGIALLITHRPAMLAVADRILILNEGRVQAFGDRNTILPRIIPQPPPAPVQPSRQEGEAQQGEAKVRPRRRRSQAGSQHAQS